jgi:hypothetical protein
MYSAENVNLKTRIALLALLDEAGDPGTPITGTIKNYLLVKQDDQFIAQWYALGGTNDTPIWWVGTDIPDGTRLCDDPNRNSTDTEAITCRSKGVHDCTGALGLVHDTDIALVACRGSWVDGAVPGGDTATSYDADSEDSYNNADALLNRLESGDEAEVTLVEGEVDALPQEKIALLITVSDFANWQRARWLKEYAKQNDLEQFFGQLESNKATLDAVMTWLTTIPSYGAAVDGVATSYAGVFAQWLERASQEVQAALLARPAIAQVRDDETLSAAGALTNPPTEGL